VALFDHEEVGSESADGAAGPHLRMLMQRLLRKPSQRRRAWLRSLLISADAGHALHPNFPDQHDPGHAPVLNGGPMLKTSVAQRYATDALGAAVFRQLCRQCDVPHQEFVNRPDLACGSTIGPKLGSQLGIASVDIGIPLLSMHSIREQAGCRDQAWTQSVLERFLSCRTLPAARALLTR
jgi:aspartyl aminopeptidase